MWEKKKQHYSLGIFNLKIHVETLSREYLEHRLGSRYSRDGVSDSENRTEL